MKHKRLAISLLAVVLASLAVIVVASGGSSADPAGAAAAGASTAVALPGPIPERRKAIDAVQPVAGETGEASVDENVESAPVDVQVSPEKGGVDLTRVRAQRVGKEGGGYGGGDVVRKADVVGKGIALPPLDAPDEVRKIIESGNSIARTPYLWGGGHVKWLDKGYDCSGSVSFALASAGLLSAPLASGPFMKWGKSGKGKWVTIYANPGHMFMVVAGVRFDTSGTKVTGSRWQNSMRGSGGYVMRHPPGL